MLICCWFIKNVLLLCLKLGEWRGLMNNTFTYKVQPISFPENGKEEWRKLFKPCAAQRLFLPVSYDRFLVFHVYFYMAYLYVCSYVCLMFFLNSVKPQLSESFFSQYQCTNLLSPASSFGFYTFGYPKWNCKVI